MKKINSRAVNLILSGVVIVLILIPELFGRSLLLMEITYSFSCLILWYRAISDLIRFIKGENRRAGMLVQICIAFLLAVFITALLIRVFLY